MTKRSDVIKKDAKNIVKRVIAYGVYANRSKLGRPPTATTIKETLSRNYDSVL